MLSEPIAYPFVLAAVATGVRCARPADMRTIALFVGFVVLASFARLQFAVLLPCFLVASLACLSRTARQGHLRRHWRSACCARAGDRRARGRGPGAQHRLLPELPSRRHRRRQPGLLARPERLDPRDRYRDRAPPGRSSERWPRSSVRVCVPSSRSRSSPLAVTVALLLQASIYGDTHVAQTRYTFYLVPLWVISFLLCTTRLAAAAAPSPCRRSAC